MCSIFKPIILLSDADARTVMASPVQSQYSLAMPWRFSIDRIKAFQLENCSFNRLVYGKSVMAFRMVMLSQLLVVSLNDLEALFVRLSQLVVLDSPVVDVLSIVAVGIQRVFLLLQHRRSIPKNIEVLHAAKGHVYSPPTLYIAYFLAYLFAGRGLSLLGVRGPIFLNEFGIDSDYRTFDIV